ncbi:hypothetical protein FF021_17245 [Leptospira noguchii]|nr:hypothetical protein FF021_17245 [Leptospira noguchii]
MIPKTKYYINFFSYNWLTKTEKPAKPDSSRFSYVTHNYIIKYLIFCMKSVFCDKINGIQFYRDQ